METKRKVQGEEKKDWLDEYVEGNPSFWDGNPDNLPTYRQLIEAVLLILEKLKDEWSFRDEDSLGNMKAVETFLRWLKERIKR